MGAGERLPSRSGGDRQWIGLDTRYSIGYGLYGSAAMAMLVDGEPVSVNISNASGVAVITIAVATLSRRRVQAPFFRCTPRNENPLHINPAADPRANLATPPNFYARATRIATRPPPDRGPRHSKRHRNHTTDSSTKHAHDHDLGSGLALLRRIKLA
jgi:hypothetical protein